MAINEAAIFFGPILYTIKYFGLYLISALPLYERLSYRVLSVKMQGDGK